MHPEFTCSNEGLGPRNYLVPYTGTAKSDWFSYRNASAGYPRGTTPGLVHGSHCGTTLTPLASPAYEDSKPTRFRPISRTYDSRPRSGRCQRDDFSYDIRQPARFRDGLTHFPKTKAELSSVHTSSPTRRATGSPDDRLTRRRPCPAGSARGALRLLPAERDRVVGPLDVDLVPEREHDEHPEVAPSHGRIAGPECL